MIAEIRAVGHKRGKQLRRNRGKKWRWRVGKDPRFKLQYKARNQAMKEH